MSSDVEEVYLYVYDLSGGLAARYSPSLLGKQVEGIWHTGVVVYGKEYYFGSTGIQIARPGTVIGEPLKKIPLGKTEIPSQIFEEYLSGLSESEFRGVTYDLLRHNCNNFSDTISNFLVGQGIPDYILRLPDEILNTTFGQTFRGLVEQIERNSLNNQHFPLQPVREPSPEFYQINSEIEALRHNSLLLKEKRNKIYEKLARKERKKNKRRRESESSRNQTTLGESTKPEQEKKRMSEEGGGGGGGGPTVAGSVEEENSSPPRLEREEATRQLAEAIEEDERREREERRKNREPPIVFKDAVDIHIEFDSLVGLIDGKLTEEEQLSLEELHRYMLEDEGSWALGEQFLAFVGRLLTDKSLGEEVPVRTLQVLSAAALKDDVILLLHQDRKQHVLMNYAFEVDRHPLPQQKALSLFLCNLFENIGSSEWLMYISEWSYNTNQLSNIRVTTKVAVNALLSDDLDMQDRGSAIIHNIATKEKMLRGKTLRQMLPAGSASKVFDDIAVELTMAVLQFLSGENRPESQVYRCLRSLGQFLQVTGQDIPQLVQMIGPHPSKFKGLSERVDSLVEDLSKKIR